MRCDLQIISGCVCHLEQLHAQSPFLFPIVFGINASLYKMIRVKKCETTGFEPGKSRPGFQNVTLHCWPCIVKVHLSRTQTDPYTATVLFVSWLHIKCNPEKAKLLLPLSMQLFKAATPLTITQLNIAGKGCGLFSCESATASWVSHGDWTW